jgi:hypothetical protein
VVHGKRGLGNNRPLIQFVGNVVAGRADDFHPALVSLMVGL